MSTPFSEGAAFVGTPELEAATGGFAGDGGREVFVGIEVTDGFLVWVVVVNGFGAAYFDRSLLTLPAF